ncbi:hypothetical protein GCM10015535_37720 [Streptomyces gelaticus]|uniref:Uncharacterized protein n=1 Tax=Streptomyces gelaticus TaxID=285446 RepID=A0ABQ2W0D0_9ACTN|nr:hypothetical protein GCM10015535_37720 [Streptomyces gelaticus]
MPHTQDGAEALDQADGGQAEAVAGEQQREDSPGEAVVEVVDQSGLAGAAQGAVVPGGAGDEGGLQAGVLAGGHGLGVAGEFKRHMGGGVADDERQGCPPTATLSSLAAPARHSRGSRSAGRRVYALQNTPSGINDQESSYATAVTQDTQGGI